MCKTIFKAHFTVAFIFVHAVVLNCLNQRKITKSYSKYFSLILRAGKNSNTFRDLDDISAFNDADFSVYTKECYLGELTFYKANTKNELNLFLDFDIYSLNGRLKPKGVGSVRPLFGPKI